VWSCFNNKNFVFNKKIFSWIISFKFISGCQVRRFGLLPRGLRNRHQIRKIIRRFLEEKRNVFLNKVKFCSKEKQIISNRSLLFLCHLSYFPFRLYLVMCCDNSIETPQIFNQSNMLKTKLNVNKWRICNCLISDFLQLNPHCPTFL